MILPILFIKSLTKLCNKEALRMDELIIHWLLEPDNPSVRYFTLRELLRNDLADAEISQAQDAIMQYGPAATILTLQEKEGFWGDPVKFYTQKYTGTVWQLMILAELGACSADERIKRACEFILNHSQDRDSWGFSVYESSKIGGGRHSEVVPCLTGNMVWSLIKLGYLPDERLQRAITWICQYQRCDDGIADNPTGWPYDRYRMCWGTHSCHMGVVKSLKALTAIPYDLRNQVVNQKISELVEYILKHHIYLKSHNLNAIARPGWLKLGFPLMYQSDILEILEILTDLDIHDDRMNQALKVLQSKRKADGKWKLENSFNGKMLVDIENKGQPSKWITLKALKILSQ